MYGGHITDDWDRRLCNAYLEELMQSDLVSNSHAYFYFGSKLNKEDNFIRNIFSLNRS